MVNLRTLLGLKVTAMEHLRSPSDKRSLTLLLVEPMFIDKNEPDKIPLIFAPQLQVRFWHIWHICHQVPYSISSIGSSIQSG